MALIGVVFTMILTGTIFSMQAFIGCIMLAGIVVNNAILIVDFTNQLRRNKNMGLFEAITVSCSRRVRPILMTTFSIIAGLIPTAVAIGTGAATRSAIAVTIIGGQTLCLLLTLLVVPVGYSYLEDARAWFARRRHHEAAAATGD